MEHIRGKRLGSSDNSGDHRWQGMVAGRAVEIMGGRGGWQGELWVAGGRKEFSSSLSSNLPVVS